MLIRALFYAQLSSRGEENTFHTWIYNGIKTWTVYIWCVSICSYDCTFWGDYNSNFYLKWLISFLMWCLFRIVLLLLHILCISAQVLREEEFAPVKNANGSNVDTPDSAKLLVLRLHTRWVVAAGGFLTHSVPLYATGKLLLHSLEENKYNCAWTIVLTHTEPSSARNREIVFFEIIVLLNSSFSFHEMWLPLIQVLKCHHSVRMLVKTWNLYVEEEHFMHLVRSHSSSTVRSCGFPVTYTTMREFSVPFMLQH